MNKNADLHVGAILDMTGMSVQTSLPLHPSVQRILVRNITATRPVSFGVRDAEVLVEAKMHRAARQAQNHVQ